MIYASMFFFMCAAVAFGYSSTRGRALRECISQKCIEKSSKIPRALEESSPPSKCASCGEPQKHAFADEDGLCDGCMIHGAKPKTCKHCGDPSERGYDYCPPCRDNDPAHLRKVERKRVKAVRERTDAELLEQQRIMYGMSSPGCGTISHGLISKADWDVHRRTTAYPSIPRYEKRPTRICHSCGDWDCRDCEPALITTQNGR